MEEIAIQPVLSVEGSRKQELPAHRFVNATVDAAAAKVSGLTGTGMSPPLTPPVAGASGIFSGLSGRSLTSNWVRSIQSAVSSERLRISQ